MKNPKWSLFIYIYITGHNICIVYSLLLDYCLSVYTHSLLNSALEPHPQAPPSFSMMHALRKMGESLAWYSILHDWHHLVQNTRMVREQYIIIQILSLLTYSVCTPSSRFNTEELQGDTINNYHPALKTYRLWFAGGHVHVGYVKLNTRFSPIFLYVSMK